MTAIAAAFCVAPATAGAVTATDRAVMPMATAAAGGTAFWNEASGVIQSKQAAAPGVTVPTFDTGTAFLDPAAAANDTCGGQASGGNNAGAVSMGDVNDDGLADLLVGCLWDAQLGVKTGNAFVVPRNAANTGWDTAIELFDPNPTASAFCGSSTAFGDVNGDGLDDVVMGCYGANQVIVFASNGGTPVTFDAGVEVTPAGGTSCGNAVATGDVDGDGLADLAIGCSSSGASGPARIAVSNGGSPLTFDAPVVLTNARSSCGTGITTGDFNGDGLADVAVSCSAWSTANNNAVIHGSQGGSPVTFAAGIEKFPPAVISSDSCKPLDTADLDADGLDDLVMGCSQSTVTQGNGRVILFESTGGPPAALTFAAAVVLTQSVAPVKNCGYSIALGDLDADGLVDIAAGCALSNGTTAGQAVYWLTQGGGPITASTSSVLLDPAPVASDKCGLSMAAGDVDGDGMADLAMGCPGDDTGFSAAGNVILYGNTTSLAFGASQVIATRKMNRTAMTVTHATLNADVRLNGNGVTYEMSANGGTNWAAVTLGVSHTFAVTGTDLRVRMTLTSAANTTALVHDLVVTYDDLVNVAPTATLVTPLAAATSRDSTPDLVATFNDGNVGDTGTLAFEVCTANPTPAQTCAAAGGSISATGTSASGIAIGANGTITVSPSLSDATYYWRVKATDSNALAGAWTTARSVIIAANLSTTTMLTGFEAGTLNASGGGLVSAISSPTAPTIDTLQIRSGSYSMKVAAPGGGVADYAQFTAAGNLHVARFAIRLQSLPLADADVASIVPAAGNALRIRYKVSTNKWVGQIGAVQQAIPGTVTAGQWYVFSIRGVVNTSPRTLDWTVDGVAQTTVTGPVEGGSVVNALRLGTAVTTEVFTANYDDVIMSATTGDYPIGDGRVKALRVDGAGTNVGGANFTHEDATAVGASTYLRLDDKPMTAIDDYVQQSTKPSAGSYVESTLENTSEVVTARALRAVVAYHSSGTAANAGSTLLVRSDLSTGTVYTGDMSETTSFVQGAVISAPAGGWTPTQVNALKVRVGYSASLVGDPTPYWDSVLVEADYPTNDTNPPPTMSISLSTLGYTDAGRTNSAPYNIAFGSIMPGSSTTIGPVGSGQTYTADAAAVKVTVTNSIAAQLQVSASDWTAGANRMPPAQLEWRHHVPDAWTPFTSTSRPTEAAIPPGGPTLFEYDFQFSIPALQAPGAYSGSVTYTLVAQV